MPQSNLEAELIPYTKLERLLHRLVLNSKLCREMTFDLDVALARLKGGLGVEHPSGPIYICGLARSGTTILLQLIAGLPDMVSLTYRAMPFVMAPRLAVSFYGKYKKSIARRERLHGDGLMIDLDTAEAFEEVFWMTKNAAKADKNIYQFINPTPDTLAEFSIYRRLVANTALQNRVKIGRYVSKNNNNIGRLSSLLATSHARVLFIFRNPLTCAASMIRMHRKVDQEVQASAFVGAYLSYLGHHEFGPTHLPFDFAVPFQDLKLNVYEPDYWLDYWCAVHKGLFSKLTELPQIILLNYEKLIEDPRRVLAETAQILDLGDELLQRSDIVRKPWDRSGDIVFSKSKIAEAEMIFIGLQKLSERSF